MDRQGMILDTTFLIDLEREAGSGHPAGATEFLKAHPSTRFSISVITVSEFAEGFDAKARRACRKALRPYSILGLNFDTAWRAGISRVLREDGQRIGDHDILIAATALEHSLPLVSRNTDHFQRIENLQLVGY